MFDTPFQIFDFSFIKIFGVLIAIVFLIYRFQVIKLFFNELGNWRSRKIKREADRLKFTRLPDELDEIINKNNVRFTAGTGTVFHLLKVVNAENVYVVYLSLTGGSIKLVDILSKDFESKTVLPKILIENNSAFNFGFTLADNDKTSVHFKILYEDQFNGKNMKEYILFMAESILEEIK